MNEFLNVIIESPIRAIAVLLMFACVGLLGVIAKALFKRFTEHESKLQIFEASIEHSSRETRRALHTHSEDLTKTTKTINADMLAVQKGLLTVKEDLLNRTMELERYARQLEAQTKGLAQVFDTNLEKFDVKLGHIVNLRKELATAYGKIERLEESSGKFQILAADHAKHLKNVYAVLRKHDDTLKGTKK